MNLAKLTAAGQVTVPVEIRRMLRLKKGDKVLFLQNEKGEVVIDNASVNTIYKARMAFVRVNDGLGNKDEEEIKSWVDEMRYGADAPN